MTDLGTLGGANSSVPWPQKNSSGLIVGQAQGSLVDPLGENWGEAYGCNTTSGVCNGNQNVQLGFRWQKGVMTALPALGGNNSTATGDNDKGQVAGWAETGTRDKRCVPPQVLDIEAVVYGQTGEVQQILPPLPGDVLSAALGINHNGDVVGLSGTCGTPDTTALAVHAVLWRNGSVFDLGGFGGKMNNYAIAINNVGQIVGASDLKHDTTTHGFLWQNGVMTDLGTLPGDVMSIPRTSIRAARSLASRAM
jgi:probable HAF family extracellular repeat protein